jgi:hypothetical protein
MSRWNTTHRFMIIHGTPIYLISLIYRKRHKGYDSDTITLQKYQLFDLTVKGEWQKCDHVGTWHTLSWLYTYIPNIIDLSEETKKLWPDSKFANPFRLNKELTPFLSIFLYNFTYIFFIWNVTHQFLNFIFLRNIWTIQLQKIRKFYGLEMENIHPNLLNRCRSSTSGG